MMSGVEDKWWKDDLPLIFSILLGSSFSPTHESPSIFCAYSCHSVKKPIYPLVISTGTKRHNDR